MSQGTVERLEAAHLVDGEANAEILHAHLLLLASVLLHECQQHGALAVTIIILVQLYHKLWVLDKGWVVAASTSCATGSQPASIVDD